MFQRPSPCSLTGTTKARKAERLPRTDELDAHEALELLELELELEVWDLAIEFDLENMTEEEKRRQVETLV
jgi:hypothetical protein